MRSKIIPFLSLCTMLLSLTMLEGIAQTNHEQLATIPFDFIVCEQKLPAGVYKVRPFSSANPRIILISNDDTRSVIMSCAHDVQAKKPASTGRLIFNRYGNQYFLSELWLQGEITGSQLVKSEQEEAILQDVQEIKKRGKVTIKVTEVKP